MTKTFKVNRLNQLTNATRDGTITVAGMSDGATSVTVNGSAAERYDDGTFARTNLTLNTGNTTFTAIASDASGRNATNAVTVTMPPSVNFTNDVKGNLTSDGRRTFVYDDENQLIQVTIAGSTQSKFAYDGLGRRRIRTELLWQGGAWVTNSVTRYVYAGLLVVQERDGNNVPVVAYTRGQDLSGTPQGAGGIGGLLARTDQKQQPHSHAFYHADGNGNVTALIDGNEQITARYSYDPFGNVLAMAGPLAEANLYRFSSKEAHSPSGLVYYGYRFYDANLQRWINRDPIQETGGINLYAFVLNYPTALIDPWGLQDGGDDMTQVPGVDGNDCPSPVSGGREDWGPQFSQEFDRFKNEVGKELACSAAGGIAGRAVQPIAVGIGRGLSRVVGEALDRCKLRRVSKIKGGPDFPRLKDHAARHSSVHPNAYYNGAVRHVQECKDKFKFYHDGQFKNAYVTRAGPDTFIFTSTSLNNRTIFTHFLVKTQYLKNIGITLPEGL